jgi:hypothetical protein
MSAPKVVLPPAPPSLPELPAAAPAPADPPAPMVTETELAKSDARNMRSIIHPPPPPPPPLVTVAVASEDPPPPPPPAPHTRTRTTEAVKLDGLFQVPFALKVWTFVGRAAP